MKRCFRENKIVLLLEPGRAAQSARSPFDAVPAVSQALCHLFERTSLGTRKHKQQTHTGEPEKLQSLVNLSRGLLPTLDLVSLKSHRMVDWSATVCDVS